MAMTVSDLIQELRKRDPNQIVLLDYACSSRCGEEKLVNVYDGFYNIEEKWFYLKEGHHMPDSDSKNHGKFIPALLLSPDNNAWAHIVLQMERKENWHRISGITPVTVFAGWKSALRTPEEKPFCYFEISRDGAWTLKSHDGSWSLKSSRDNHCENMWDELDEIIASVMKPSKTY